MYKLPHSIVHEKWRCEMGHETTKVFADFLGTLHKIEGVANGVVHNIVRPRVNCLKEKDERLRHLLEKEEEITEQEKSEVLALMRSIEDTFNGITISSSHILTINFSNHPKSQQEIVESIFQELLAISKRETVPVFLWQQEEIVRQRLPLSSTMLKLMRQRHADHP